MGFGAQEEDLKHIGEMRRMTGVRMAHGGERKGSKRTRCVVPMRPKGGVGPGDSAGDPLVVTLARTTITGGIEEFAYRGAYC